MAPLLAAFDIPISWSELVKRTIKDANADNVLGLAAQLAYYFLLALVPAIVFLIALTSFFPPEAIDRMVAAAASVIANGGTLYEPHVVRAVVKGGHRTIVEPKVVRQAILPETAATVTEIMEKVVTEGSGRGATLVSYNVAGKTGTANKLVNGRYSDSQQNVSFVGFVPSRRPVGRRRPR